VTVEEVAEAAVPADLDSCKELEDGATTRFASDNAAVRKVWLVLCRDRQRCPWQN
jgi:hypothetical protein